MKTKPRGAGTLACRVETHLDPCFAGTTSDAQDRRSRDVPSQSRDRKGAVAEIIYDAPCSPRAPC